MPTPGHDDVVVRIDAAPINPSDLGVRFPRPDLDTVRSTGTAALPALTAKIPPAAMAGLGSRIGKALPAGNEGAGVVVAAGASPAAQALLGKTVGVYGGGMYAQHRSVPASMCLALPDGVSAEQGASNFVNPMTALCMLETMRREGHSAIVHTAAASNLGQMLVRLCAKDGVALVSVVRRDDQAARAGTASQRVYSVARRRGAEQTRSSRRAPAPLDRRQHRPRGHHAWRHEEETQAQRVERRRRRQGRDGARAGRREQPLDEARRREPPRQRLVRDHQREQRQRALRRAGHGRLAVSIASRIALPMGPPATKPRDATGTPNSDAVR
jgi:hypothetical protein